MIVFNNNNAVFYNENNNNDNNIVITVVPWKVVSDGVAIGGWAVWGEKQKCEKCDLEGSRSI